MLFRHKAVVLGLATGWLGVSQVHALVEDFSSDPFSTWSFGVGDNSNNQFVWNSGTAPVYSGDDAGSLGVHLDSSLPTARLQRPLGVTVTDTDSFTLKTRFSFAVTSAPKWNDIQLAFGLVNGILTGGDRTGSSANYSSDNVFDTVEFNYFANANTWDPTLMPIAFGSQKNGLDAFGNSAGIYGSDSSLSSHSNGITALPPSVTLEAVLSYDGNNKLLTLTMNQVLADGSISNLVTELPSLSLPTPTSWNNYDTNFPFVVDSMAIMAYQDGFNTDLANPSLVADLTFQRFEFTTAVPEPSVCGLVIMGMGGALVTIRRRRS